MRLTLPLLTSALLLSAPRTARAWPDWGVSAGVATASGVSDQGGWQTYGPVVATDVTWRGGWSECFTGVAVTGLVGPADEGGVRPLSLLSAEAGAGVGVPLLSAGVYGGFGWPGGTVGLYGRVTVPSAEGWARRIGVEGRLFATTAEAATGGALLVRIEPDPHARMTARARSEAEAAAPAPAAAPTETPPSEPPPAPPPEHHDDPYGG